MKTENTDKRSGVVMGALLADAASLGLHWLYDPARIETVASAHGQAAFVPIDARNFDGVPGYFAHAARCDGMLSQYGECLRLAVDVMNDHDGRLDVPVYQQRFASFFGMGGGYVGYIDRPTRGTVENILAGNSDPSGVDDDQHPAIARLPAVVAGRSYQRALAGQIPGGQIKEAVQITNLAPAALDYADVVARLLVRVLAGAEIGDALRETVRETPDDEIRARLSDALETNETNSVAYGEVTERACHLYQGVPLAFHVLDNAVDYRDAVNRNTLAGGDSCGRAMIVGAVAGAAAGGSGLPVDWMVKLHAGDVLWAGAKALVEEG